MMLKPAARKYRFDEVPPERERWLALPLEVRLRAVVEMAEFWARVRLEEAQARGEAPTPHPYRTHLPGGGQTTVVEGISVPKPPNSRHLALSLSRVTSSKITVELSPPWRPSRAPGG